MEKLKYLFILLLPVAVFASSLSGVGTDTITVDHDLWGIWSFDGYSGSDIEGTASNPAYFDMANHTGYSVVLFIESSNANYGNCVAGTAQQCLDANYGELIGSTGGYTVVDGIWEEVGAGSGTGTSTAVTILSEFFNILLIGLLVPLVIIYFYWWITSTSRKI